MTTDMSTPNVHTNATSTAAIATTTATSAAAAAAAQIETELEKIVSQLTPSHFIQSLPTSFYEYTEVRMLQDVEMEEEERFIANLSPELCCFFAVRVPPMSFEGYLGRLMHYCRCAPICFPVALWYLARLRRGGLLVSPRSVHRIYLACLVLAIKYCEDKYFQLGYYAQCGGVAVSELVAMERSAFALLGYDCGVAPSELQRLGELLQGRFPVVSRCSHHGAERDDLWCSHQNQFPPRSHSMGSSPGLTPSSPALSLPHAASHSTEFLC